MTGFQDTGGIPVDRAITDGHVYFVRECGFTFCFANRAQLEEARAYFAQKVHPSNRRVTPHEHYWNRWFERLPAGLNGGSRRTRILAALERAPGAFGWG